MLAISVGGRNITATTEKILMMLFCSRLIRPSTASSMNWTLPPRKLAWSDSDCTSRSVDLKRPLWSFDSVTFEACCTYMSRRWKLTRLSRVFEIRSPLTPIFWIIPCRSRLVGDSPFWRGKIVSEMLSSSSCTFSSTSAIRSMKASSRPASSVAEDVQAMGERSTYDMNRRTGVGST
jgi:hypothetical protein